jgi:RND family efflux transporter MFP subunit
MPRSQVITVSAVRAERGALREQLALTGALKPKEQVDVTPKSTGRLEKIHFHVGDAVQAGALIAELERDELEQQVRRSEAMIGVARASLAQRSAELSNAEAQLGRAERLRADGLISAQDLEAQTTQAEVVRAQVRLAQAQMEQAEAELRELKIRLEQTRVYSPMNGHIAARYVDVGALLGPTTPIVRMVNLNTMVTAANVPERDVGKLRLGNRAMVRVDAFGDRQFTGRVARISPVLDAATRTANIEIEIPNPGALLKAEMFARVELDLETTRQAVLIPREALVYRGTQPGVYLIHEDRPEFRPIEAGMTQGDRVEVLGNLAPGTLLVGRGSSMIAEGDRIRLAKEGAGEGGPARMARQEPPAADPPVKTAPKPGATPTP